MTNVLSKVLMLLFVLGTVHFASAQAPSLPTTWVDNNELTCLITSTCYPGSPALTTPYTAPYYTLTLSLTAAPVWSPNQPSGCTFSYLAIIGSGTTNNSYWPANPSATQLGTGFQKAITEVETCRTTLGNIAQNGFIVQRPPAIYQYANGLLIPQSSAQQATAPIIIQSTADSTLASMPEPVCAGGIQDNILESTNIGLINSDCRAGGAGGTFGFQLGNAVTLLSTGQFTLANNIQTSSSNYNYYQYMYEDQCTNNACVPFQMCSPYAVTNANKCGSSIGPDHWEFEDGAASVAAAPGTTDGEIVSAGPVITGASSLSQMASHIHFRRYWAHGSWTSLSEGSESTSAAFALGSCQYCSVVGSQVSQVLRPGNEGHDIAADGQQLKIENDWLEGLSSGIFAGGFTNAPNIAGYVPAQDVQIGRVRSTFPYSWLGQMHIQNNPYYSGSLVRKNCMELKEGERILLYGSICENVDNSGAQSGNVTLFQVRNVSGGTPTNYQATINDLTVENTIYRTACSGIGLGGRSDSAAADGGGVSYPMDRVAFDNILMYGLSLDSVLLSGSCTGANDSGGIKMGGGSQSWQGTITENSEGTGATFVASCSQDAGDCIGQVSSYSITNAGTACTAGSLKISASPSGQPNDTATATYTCNAAGQLSAVSIKNNGAYYTSAPTVTGFSKTCTGCAVTLVLNSANIPLTSAYGFQVMDIYAGDPIEIKGCENAAFNLPLKKWGNGYNWPAQVQATATAGTASWYSYNPPNGGFNIAEVTVPYTYTWENPPGGPGTPAPNTPENSGYCTLSNEEGSPENLSFNHVTLVTDNNAPIGGSSDLANGPQFARNFALVNDFIVGGAGGWKAPDTGEGNSTEMFDYDALSMTAAWLVWPGQSTTNYVEYPNNPYFPDLTSGHSIANCGANNWNPDIGGTNPYIGGCEPPVTMYFPANSCAALGMSCSDTPVPITLSDYHGYELLSTSPYAGQASDLTDIGAIIPTIDSAQTTTLFSCPSGSCTVTWPFPD